MANLNQIVANTNSNGAHNGANSDITSLTACTQITGMTTPLTVPQGGTGVATLTSAAPVVGAGASALTTGLSTVTNAITVDVNLANTSNYYDGPSCAQGATGTWLATGTVTVDPGALGAAANIRVKLWDGTTVIASTICALAPALFTTVTLSGILATPAGNIKISVNCAASTNPSISANGSGNGNKDSKLTVIRIA